MKIIPTYAIWRVQDFYDLDKRDIIYRIKKCRPRFTF